MFALRHFSKCLPCNTLYFFCEKPSRLNSVLVREYYFSLQHQPMPLRGHSLRRGVSEWRFGLVTNLGPPNLQAFASRVLPRLTSVSVWIWGAGFATILGRQKFLSQAAARRNLLRVCPGFPNLGVLCAGMAALAALLGYVASPLNV